MHKGSPSSNPLYIHTNTSIFPSSLTSSVYQSITMAISRYIIFLSIALSFLLLHVHVAEATRVGINYGRVADNLPSPSRTVSVMKSRNITRVRIFDPDHGVLAALAEAGGMEVVLGTVNSDLEQLAINPSFAAQWVAANVVPFHPALKFRYVAAGNEVIPGPLAPHVLGAMQNLDNALKSVGIVGVPVSTALSFAAIGKSFPPSAGEFAEESMPFMAPIIEFLAKNDYPLLVNAYPYFAYKSDPVHIDLDYALGNPGKTLVVDGRLKYRSLFDAMVDTMYAAAEKVNGAKVRMVVTETGWPSAGSGAATTLDKAKAYVNNAAAKAGSGTGTPRRPEIETETYLFALFNEDLKQEGEERNFGMYWPDFTEVYHVDFPGGYTPEGVRKVPEGVRFEMVPNSPASAPAPEPTPASAPLDELIISGNDEINNGHALIQNYGSKYIFFLVSIIFFF
ncbi:Putative glucan endo-1,3-beta-glucosidase GVI (Fragment) [Linum grandiflorum]